MAVQAKRVLYLVAMIAAFVISGGVYNITCSGPQLWGHLFPLELAMEIFPKEFSWPGFVPNHFKIVSGAFSGNRSKCNTVIFHLDPVEPDRPNGYGLIIGKIDDLPFSQQGLKISEANYSSVFTATPEKRVSGISNTYVLYVPWATFNTRLPPKGQGLEIYGLRNYQMHKEQLGDNYACLIDGEPYRGCRRQNKVRDYCYGKTKQVFTGGPGTGRADGRGAS